MTNCQNCNRLRERITAMQDIINAQKLQIVQADISAKRWRDEARKNMQIGLTSHKLNDMLHQMNGKKGTV